MPPDPGGRRALASVCAERRGAVDDGVLCASLAESREERQCSEEERSIDAFGPLRSGTPVSCRSLCVLGLGRCADLRQSSCVCRWQNRVASAYYLGKVRRCPS